MGGTRQFSVNSAGAVNASAFSLSYGGFSSSFEGNNRPLFINHASGVKIIVYGDRTQLLTEVAVGADDLRIARDAADTLAQRRSTNAQTFRVYNTFTSATNFERLNLRWTSNEAIIDTEAGSGDGTLRGLKIGSASTSLLGFYGATPVVRGAAVADATDAASVITQLNALLARIRTLGLIAT